MSNYQINKFNLKNKVLCLLGRGWKWLNMQILYAQMGFKQICMCYQLLNCPSKDLGCFLHVLSWILLKSRKDLQYQTLSWPAALRKVRSLPPQASIFHTLSATKRNSSAAVLQRISKKWWKTANQYHILRKKTTKFQKGQTHSTAFNTVRHHDDACHFLFPDHPPEIVDSGRQWTLGGNILIAVFVALKNNCFSPVSTHWLPWNHRVPVMCLSF